MERDGRVSEFETLQRIGPLKALVQPAPHRLSQPIPVGHALGHEAVRQAGLGGPIVDALEGLVHDVDLRHDGTEDGTYTEHVRPVVVDRSPRGVEHDHQRVGT